MSRIYFTILAFLLIILYTASCRKAGQWLIRKDELVKADAIVMLMGSISDRVIQVADLYRQKLANKVLMVEENKGAYRALEAHGVHLIGTTQQVHDAMVAMGVPSDSILILPGEANSTQMEASIIRKYLLDKPKIDTLILVSSSFHTQRAFMTFQSVFRNTKIPVKILTSPSAYTNFNGKKWWRSKAGIQTVLMEYLKMTNLILFERKNSGRKWE
jgi:uncharacterized SAM-binding protein YcdF (DUF218 family)